MSFLFVPEHETILVLSSHQKEEHGAADLLALYHLFSGTFFTSSVAPLIFLTKDSFP